MKVFIEAYLYGNLGDDLFLDILSERYPNTEFITVSHFYEPISEQVKVHNDRWLGKLIPLRKIQKFYAKKCDLVVSIGGSMYIEGVSEMSPRHNMLIRHLHIHIHSSEMILPQY